MNDSEEPLESWRRGRRTGLALFAIGAIFLLMRNFNPFNMIAGWVYFVLGLGNYSHTSLAGIFLYYEVSSVPLILLVWGTVRYYSARKKPVEEAGNGIIITCISDNEHFTNEVHRYLYDDLTHHNQNVPDDVFEIDSDTFVLDGNEIHVSKKSPVPKEVIKIILESLLNSDPEKFHDYMVIEFGDTITVGRAVMGYSVEGMFVCEICGYFTPCEGEVPSHRLTHLRV